MRRVTLLLAALLVGSTVVPAAAAEGTTVDHEADALSLSAGPAQQISGQTDLAAGTDVAVRLQSTGGDSPFLLRETSTVDENGNFTVSMDLSGVPANITAAATLRADGETVDEQAVAVESEAGGSATATSPAEDSPFSFDGEAITLSAAPDQQISGQTDLAAGTDVAVRLQSTGGESPFLQRPTATVEEDGRFSVQFNLSAVEPGDAVATLRADGETVAERAVHVESTGSDGTGAGTNDQPTTDSEQSNDDTDRGASASESTASDDSDTTTDATSGRNDDAPDTSEGNNGLSDAGLVGGSAIGILTLFGVGARLLN